MLNQNQNRYKFTVKQPSQNTTQYNRPNPTNNNYNRNQSNYQPFKQPPPKIEEHILADDKDDDDDLLDISDTELIRASQAVESQLKFTNNVHHATSNAITIFSQFTNTQPAAPMGPPQTIYSNSNFNYDGIDEMKTEIKQLKNENMQKDGEVKILRDKLKRLEQETQKMRNEKIDLIKKLQQQQDEAKRNLQKQIEFKELENQFKSQEIVELTMKYKVLESSVRKNPNTVVMTPSVNNQKIQQPKSVPTKRSAQNHSTSDTENENPDIKRPLLCPRQNTPNNNRPITTTIPKSLPKKSFKRSSVLKTRDFEPKKASRDLIYRLTDQFSESANLITSLNCGKQTLNPEILLKLIELNKFQKFVFKSKLDIQTPDKIDFICEKLNDELTKFLSTNLKYFDIESNFNIEQIDLNCLLFDILFRLFMIRFSFQIDANDTKILNKLKQDFYVFITQYLDKLKYPLLKQKATFVCYTSLKMFNSLLECINFMLYYPNMLEIGSKKQVYFLGLVDNLHSIFRNISLLEPVEGREDDDSCLYELFYDKLIKFYTDVVYWLDPNESTRNSDESILPVSNQPEIITTIVDESKNSKIDFKLENRINENFLMNNSLSEADDIFQSQVDPGVAVTKAAPLQELPPPVQTAKIQDTKDFELDLGTLKLEFFTKFVYFLHNYQFLSSLEFKLMKLGDKNEAENETNCSKKRKIYQSMSNLSRSGSQCTYIQSCVCFKDMMNSFLCLIDYQLNEKVREKYFESVSASRSNYLLNKKFEEEEAGLVDLLVLVGFNSYVSVTNVEKYEKLRTESDYIKKKLDVFDAIRDDYRLKNFMCLYKLIECGLNESQEEKMETDECMTKLSVCNHLKNSLSSLKALFKTYVDDYFDFSQNQEC